MKLLCFQTVANLIRWERLEQQSNEGAIASARLSASAENSFLEVQLTELVVSIYKTWL